MTQDYAHQYHILKENLHVKNNLLNHVYEISSLLTQSPDIDDVLNNIVDRAMNGLNFDRAIVMLLDKDEAKLECKCIKGFTPLGEKRAWNKPLYLDRHDCYETKVVQSGEPLFVEDTENASDMTEIDKIINKYQERKSVLHVPLKLKGKVIGIIGVDRYRTRMKITRNDVESLAIFANQAAIIIENARLYKALNDEKLLSENIIKCSVNGVVVSDLQGRVYHLNPKAEEILNISQEKAKKIRIDQLLQLNEKERIRIFYELKKKKNIDHFEIDYQRNDDKKLILELTAFIILDENEDVLGAVTLVNDLTEKKKMDDYLSRVEKFAALGRIVSGIAHEVRNPLASIYTTVQNLENELSENMSARDDLQNIMQEIDRVEKLIRQVLNLAKPLPLQIESVDINELLRTTIPLIEKEAKKKGIALKTTLSGDIGHAEADPNRLRQVILNLLINAIESITGKGEITVSTEMVAESDGQRKWILMKFKDNGIGISPDVIDKIFDPFFTTKNVGTGLGLSVSHKIIQDHNGMIEVESRKNNGTTFSIKLPTFA
ncbi:MAG: GAF domain-containing protein [Deltaproteobacteria bacterium]|nr:GAF domain-containing protein [Deltaproteobacteria bacterium]